MPMTPETLRALAAEVRHYSHFINGAPVAAQSGTRIERHNPATGKLAATWPAGTTRDVDLAVNVTADAFENGRWSGLSASQRATVLLRVSARLRAEVDVLALIESVETGKPWVQAGEEVLWCADIWEFAAGQARSIHGDTHSNLGSDKLGLVLREPVGPVALITPWNYPLVVLSLKLAFALGAGCTVVVKPSELTSGSTLMLAQYLVDAGLPAGAFNVVTGYGDPVGKRLAEHPDIRMISFTGSTETGKSIQQAAAGNTKKLVLELGGKNATLVLADADVDAAIDGTIKGFIYNAGAECCSGSRVFVHKSIVASFVDKLCKKLDKVNVGDPLLPTTVMGAIVSESHFAKIWSHIEEGRRVATLAFGGERLFDLPGLFLQPTVFTDVPLSAILAREETFGPVISIVPFDDSEEAIGLANDTEYGLAASIWTRNLDSALSIARRIKSGIVWINTFLDIPSEVSIGGVKQSGFGREGGKYGIEEYTVLKTVVLQANGTASRYLP